MTRLTAEAIRGLDGDLQNLLKKNGLSDKSLQLVRDYTTRQSELAKKLYLSETSGTEKDKSYSVLATKLLPKLETLGALLSNSIKVESLPWVKKLIEKSSNLTELRRMKYGDLDTLLKEATDGDRSVVESLFANGIEIREQCQRHGIGLKTEEELEEKGIKSASDMSKEQLHEVVKDTAGEEASAIKKCILTKAASVRPNERSSKKRWKRPRKEQKRQRNLLNKRVSRKE